MENNLAESINDEELRDVTLVIPDVPSDYMLDEDPYDSLYISQRYLLDALNKVNNGEDVSLIQYDNDETRELIDIYSRLFDGFENKLSILNVPENYYKPSEFLTGMNYNWSDFRSSAGEKLNGETVSLSFGLKRKIYELLDNTGNVNLKSYKVTPELQRIKSYFSSRVDSLISGEGDFNLVNELGGKSFIHEDLDGIRRFNFSEEVLNHFPKGVLIKKDDGLEGIIRGLLKIKEKGIEKFLIKPVNASSGEGIEVYEMDNLEGLLDYNFSYGDIVFEEFCDLKEMGDFFDEEYKDEPLSISVQFNNGKLIGSPTIQLTKGNEFKGNLIVGNDVLEKIGLPEMTFARINSYSNKLINELGLTGSGGFDFLIENDGNFVMIDPNLGRDTGAFPLKNFEEANLVSEDNTLLFTKVDATNVFSLEELVNVLDENDVNLIGNGNAGFLPVSFAKGNHLAIIMNGSNLEEVKELSNKINKILRERLYGEFENGGRQILSGGELIDYKSI